MSGLDETELPEGWARAQLQDCVDILDNLRVPVNSTERQGRVGTVPYYGATGQVGWIDHFLFDEELVLLGEDGAPFLDKSKEIAYIIQGKSWVNNHAHVIRARADASENQFIKFALDTFDFTDFVNGTTRLKLTQASMRQIPVLLPPLAEQRRIVAKVEELLARVNAARERLAKVPAILKRFRQSILAAACSGQLSADWRERNPSTPAAAKPLPNEYDNVPDLPPLPESWSYTNCDSLCDPDRSLTYGVIKLGDEISDGVPTLRSSDVRWLRIDETGIKRISPTIAKEYSRTFLSGGEIVVTVRGTLGGIAVVPRHMRGFNVSREVAVIPLRCSWNASFFAIAIASQGSQNWLSGVTKGVAYTGVNIADLKCLPLPVPPISEQTEIVRRVEALFTLADKIEARVQAATARVEKITQAILAKAFRGELVPTEAKIARDESRPYEPASALLTRLRALRTADSNVAQPRPRLKTESNNSSHRKPGPAKSKPTAPPRIKSRRRTKNS
jgi:type I restriction enzyme S subunit